MTTELADDVGFDEAPADESTDTMQTGAAAKPGLALVMQKNLTRIQTAMADLDRVEAELPDVEKRYATDVVYEITTTKGMKAAIEHRAAWRDRRITVEKARTMAKAPILELGRHVDSRAKRLAEQLRLGEEPIDQQIKAEEKRKDDERQARINAEAGRVLAIQEALAGIGEDVLIACGKTSADIQALIDRMTSTQPDPLVFQEQIDQARAAWSAALVKLDTALKAKLWEEEQARQREAERVAEAKRLADAEAEAVRVRIQAGEAKTALDIAAMVMACMGKPAADISEKLDLLQAAVYPGASDVVLSAQRGAIAQMQQLLSLAEAAAAREAELASLRAAQVPAPVPPAPAPEPAPAPTECGDCSCLTQCGDNAAHEAEPILDAPAMPPAAEVFTHSMPLETTEADAQPVAPEVVRAALAQSLPAHRVDPVADLHISAQAVDVLRDARDLVAYVAGAFEGKFPSHPKPSQEWWGTLRVMVDNLGPRLAAAKGGVR